MKTQSKVFGHWAESKGVNTPIQTEQRDTEQRDTAQDWLYKLPRYCRKEAQSLIDAHKNLHAEYSNKEVELEQIRAHAERLAEALKDVELRAVQDRLASGIGKRKNQTEFLLGALQRIEKAAREAWEGAQ